MSLKEIAENHPDTLKVLIEKDIVVKNEVREALGLTSKTVTPSDGPIVPKAYGKRR